MDLKTLKETPPWEWPQGTDRMLLGILRDDQRDGSDRLLAAELGGDSTVINDQLADALLSIVLSRGESEDLRARAAISLGPTLESADIDGFETPEDVPISEVTFQRIQESLRTLYMDAEVPKEVRRRVLEGSVRAPQDWHQGAIRGAYASDDASWRLTAVFCMRYIQGFDAQILEALESEDEDIHYEAICAAGNWEVDAAWSHVAGLATSESADKWLRLAAIEAVAWIRPQEAAEILIELTQSEDEDIVDAAYEAMAMSEAGLDEYEDDDDEDGYEGEDERVLH
jgi:hypothetical protein